MAIRMTYDVANTNLPDLSNIVTNIAPEDTPIYSMIGRVEARSTYHEWLQDTLNIPTGAPTPIVEGFDYASNDDTPTNRLRTGNYTQIFKRIYRVSATQRAVKTAAIGDELTYQAAKAIKEVAIDVERAIVLNSTANAGSDTTARQMGGVPAWITTNVINNGTTTSSGTTPNPLTEQVFNNAVQQAWQQGGNPNVCFAPGNIKREISQFTAGTTKVVASEDETLYAAVDVYDSDFGRIQIIAHRQGLPSSQIFILDTDLWKIAYLRPFSRQDMPKTGDWYGAAIVGELTLESRAQQGNAMVINLS